ncbi:hypothetical protein [Flavonifractor sp. An91]|uniref:hypothetical protein n=1 Tax=Flavonifractor sp. An91 TaxID=1965665 RepID=UPI000B380DA5|nr:hypothetical protein [Flavonifractor sp. An91]OUN08510.1 hypothetical protein B5G42_14330 [Flavonifractor sp. An91]
MKPLETKQFPSEVITIDGCTVIMRYAEKPVPGVMDKVKDTLVNQNSLDVFVKRKCEQKGPKKVSTFSTRFHVVSNVFPKYQMLTF